VVVVVVGSAVGYLGGKGSGGNHFQVVLHKGIIGAV